MHDQPSITRKARNRDLAPVGAPCAFARPAFNHFSRLAKNVIQDTCRAHSHDQPSITRRPVQFSLSSVCAVRIRTTSLQSLLIHKLKSNFTCFHHTQVWLQMRRNLKRRRADTCAAFYLIREIETRRAVLIPLVAVFAYKQELAACFNACPTFWASLGGISSATVYQTRLLIRLATTMTRTYLSEMLLRGMTTLAYRNLLKNKLSEHI